MSVAFLSASMTASHEDTMIAAQPVQPLDLLFEEISDAPEYDARVVQRCRALFRSFGERMTSFDLSRQIYG
jgi:hypothetical protein